MKQQTAVEWFLHQLYNKMELNGDRKVFDEIIVEAFTSEREQIINAYQADRYPCSEEDAQQYYNETYNK